VLCALLPDTPDHPLARLTIQPSIQLEAQAATALHDCRPQRLALLADAAREHQRVDLAVELHVVAAYEAKDAVEEEVEGELAFTGGRAGDLAEIGRPGQRFPTGLFVEDFFRLRWLGQHDGAMDRLDGGVRIHGSLPC
jgi:hypothetical protein